MAGERKGKAYEAVIAAVLEHLVNSGTLCETYYWNEKPDALSVEPDFTVGADASQPEKIILVTHGGSAKESNRKYWRNMGELWEAKTQLVNLPSVFSVVFDAEIKGDIQLLEAVAFDGRLVVGDAAYGSKLIEWINTKLVPTAETSAGMVGVVQDAWQKKSKNSVSGLLDALATDVFVLIQGGKPELDQLWVGVRGQSSNVVVGQKTSYFRRGIAKAILVGDLELIWQENLNCVPDFCLRLGFFEKSIGGFRLVDSDLIWLRGNLSSSVVSAVIDGAPQEQMQVWISPLRNLDVLSFAYAYVLENWAELITAKGCWHHFCETSSSKFLKKHFHDRFVPPGWLFEYLRDLLKASAKRKSAWGWSVLIADLKRIRNDASYLKFVSEVTAIPVADLPDHWSGYRTITYSLPEWVMGESRQNFPLKETDLPRLAYTLAPRLQGIPESKLENLGPEVEEIFRWGYMETKFIQYRNFDPLRTVVEVALAESGIAYEFIDWFPTCFTEKLELSGVKLNVRSGKTSLLIAGNCMIKWQTCHGGHTNDKKKELSGRGFASRFTWNVKRNKYTKRSNIKAAFLVLDGEWREKDAAVLLQAGWDQVFYPDEIDKLITAVSEA